jgi:hypothetical protein
MRTKEEEVTIQVKVKVKVTLKRAMKAKRGSRGRALIFR